MKVRVVVSSIALVSLLALLAGCNRSPVNTLARWEKDRWGMCVDAMLAHSGCRPNQPRQRAALGVLVADANPTNMGAYNAPRLAEQKLAFDPLGYCLERKLPMDDYVAQATDADRVEWLVRHGCPRHVASGRSRARPLRAEAPRSESR
ncbi:MAG: hypothetical protein KC503_44970 [Myxococcales bacterium]|nr:hypothetical protein [Myxococcales bacterium]